MPETPSRNRHRGATAAFAALVGLSAATPAPAGDAIQPIDSLREAARAHALRLTGASPAEVQAAALDPRLRLRRCETALETFPVGRVTPASSRFSVGVRCAGPRPWKLYVPVSVSRQVPVVVAARPVLRGSVLGAGDLETVMRPADQVHGRVFDDPRPLLGLVAARDLSPRQALGAGDLDRATLVERGRALRLEAEVGGVTVSMEAVALEDGGRGEIVAVRNSSSGRRVDARVVGRDRARVSP